MGKDPGARVHLSRRESQIMDILHAMRRATVEQIQERILDGPSYHSVGVLLRILEKRGHVGHEKEGRCHVYFPMEAHATASWSALSHLKRTFFKDSTPEVVSTLLKKEELSAGELERIARMIREAQVKRGLRND